MRTRVSHNRDCSQKGEDCSCYHAMKEEVRRTDHAVKGRLLMNDCRHRNAPKRLGLQDIQDWIRAGRQQMGINALQLNHVMRMCPDLIVGCLCSIKPSCATRLQTALPANEPFGLLGW